MKKIFLFVLIVFINFFLLRTEARAATFSFQPATGNQIVDSQFSTQMVLDTENRSTAGADLSLSFNPQQLEIISLTEGSIYRSYLGKNFSNTQGTASISGLIDPSDTNGYTGRGVFATIVWRAKAAGTAQVTINFTLGDRNDSNVASHTTSEDLLSGVTNGSYSITGTGSTSTTSTTPSPSPAATETGVLLQTGSLNLVLLIIGFILTLFLVTYRLRLH